MNSFTKKENALLDEAYYHYKHKSGLSVYVIPKKLSTYYAVFATRYGSVDNEFKTQAEAGYTKVPNGIAHFLEHKLFENEDGTDAFQQYAKTGAEANAFTSFIKTSYLFTCTDQFYESLRILLETVSKPYFTPETVKKEQGIIGEEIGMMNDSPGWVLTFNMLAGLYKEHSVKINIAGSTDSIAQITADTLYKCYKTFYHPSNMILVLCGDIEPEKVSELLDQTIPCTPTPGIESIYAKEAPEAVTPYTEAYMDIAKPLFSIGIKDVQIAADPVSRLEKIAYLSVILEAMFGPSSAIYNSLYEQGLITGGLGYEFEHNRSFSFIEITGETDELDTVFKQLKAAVDEIKKSGIDKEIFERAKKVVYAQTIKSFDSSEEIGNLFMANMIDSIDAFDIPDAIADVNYEKAYELIQSMFQKDYCTVSVIKPRTDKQDTNTAE
ncbi:MAG: insulinase family protein [Clostridiales bacterium]|nr:insulinase family protein [Clostridiales bacterium]